MKSKMFALLSLCLMATSTYSNINLNGEPTRKLTESKKEDSTNVEEAVFEVTFSQEYGKIIVHIQGEFDDYSSVSITNNRGSEYQFSFIQNGSNDIEFNVSDLKPGSYYVVLNTNQEIRMKRFLKK